MLPRPHAPRPKVALALAIAVASLALAPRPAAASPEYPGAIQSLLDMGCAPPCTICHIDNRGGRGRLDAAHKPFVASALNDGLVALIDTSTENPSQDPKKALRRILDQLEKDAVDSDKDGVADITELREGSDPNFANRRLPCPKYGCGARIDPRGGLDDGAFVAAVLTALALAAATRRR